MRVLVVTAVVEEAEAVVARAGRAVHAPVGPYREGWLLTPGWGDAQVLVGGVGPAAAAASTAVALARSGPFDLVLDVGVAGGFAGRSEPGDVVVADAVVAADLGAEEHDEVHGAASFVPLDAMGFGAVRFDLDRGLFERAADTARSAWTDVVVGTVLTVSTVTGTEASTRRLADAHPGAVAEAMEGFGVVTAAVPWDVPVLEVRSICNPVGVSDRAQWDLPRAFAALEVVSEALLADMPRLLGSPA